MIVVKQYLRTFDASDAACRGSNVNFFPGRTDRAGIAAAKAVCESCPVKTACRFDAIANAEMHGVWGGLSEAERRALLGRSRKRRTTRRLDQIVPMPEDVRVALLKDGDGQEDRDDHLYAAAGAE